MFQPCSVTRHCAARLRRAAPFLFFVVEKTKGPARIWNSTMLLQQAPEARNRIYKNMVFHVEDCTSCTNLEIPDAEMYTRPHGEFDDLGHQVIGAVGKKIDHFCVLNDRLYRGQGNNSENSSSHTSPVKNYALRGHSKNTSLIGGRM